MISVNIAVLKAKLSFYLGRVKQGDEVLVMDRNTPVARLVASAGGAHGLVLIAAKKRPAELKGMNVRSVKRRTDIVGLLRKERDLR